MNEHDIRFAPPRQIRVMIVDDHAIVREGLRAIIAIQRDMQVVAETGEADRVVSLYATSRPDIVLMDLRLHNGSGLDAIAALCSAFADCRIVVLSNYRSEEQVFRAVAAGAKGYIVKDADPANIVDALRAVNNGQRYLSPEVTACLAERIHRSSLTPRETDVLALLARGSRNRGIAATLGIAEETVKGHVKNILGKLGATDRTEAASEAIRRGLIDVG